MEQAELLSLGKKLGENTPRTNAKLLKRVLGQMQAGQHLNLDQVITVYRDAVAAKWSSQQIAICPFCSVPFRAHHILSRLQITFPIVLECD